MARATEPRDPLLHFLPFKFPFVAFIRMTRAWDEMMPCEHRNAATAELAALPVIHFEKIVAKPELTIQQAQSGNAESIHNRLVLC